MVLQETGRAVAGPGMMMKARPSRNDQGNFFYKDLAAFNFRKWMRRLRHFWSLLVPWLSFAIGRQREWSFSRLTKMI